MAKFRVIQIREVSKERHCFRYCFRYCLVRTVCIINVWGYSDVSLDVTPRSRGVVYFRGWQKHAVAWCLFLNLPPKKRVRGENTGELLLRNCTNRFTNASGIIFFIFPESEPKRTTWMNAVRRKDWTPSEFPAFRLNTCTDPQIDVSFSCVCPVIDNEFRSALSK